jgi:hypothetical protein
MHCIWVICQSHSGPTLADYGRVLVQFLLASDLSYYFTVYTVASTYVLSSRPGNYSLNISTHDPLYLNLPKHEKWKWYYAGDRVEVVSHFKYINGSYICMPCCRTLITPAQKADREEILHFVIKVPTLAHIPRRKYLDIHVAPSLNIIHTAMMLVYIYR